MHLFRILPWFFVIGLFSCKVIFPKEKTVYTSLHPFAPQCTLELNTSTNRYKLVWDVSYGLGGETFLSYGTITSTKDSVHLRSDYQTYSILKHVDIQGGYDSSIGGGCIIKVKGCQFFQRIEVGGHILKSDSAWFDGNNYGLRLDGNSSALLKTAMNIDSIPVWCKLYDRRYQKVHQIDFKLNSKDWNVVNIIIFDSLECNFSPLNTELYVVDKNKLIIEVPYGKGNQRIILTSKLQAEQIKNIPLKTPPQYCP